MKLGTAAVVLCTTLFASVCQAIPFSYHGSDELAWEEFAEGGYQDTAAQYINSELEALIEQEGGGILYMYICYCCMHMR